MKTLFTTFTVAASLLISTNVHSQAMAVANTDMIQADEASTSNFTISGTSIQPVKNGLTVTWDAHNQFKVASYEIQLSEDNNNFSTVKRRTSGPEINTSYQVQLTNTLILANTVYFRIKVVTLDGKVSYTESTRVRVEQQ